MNRISFLNRGYAFKGFLAVIIQRFYLFTTLFGLFIFLSLIFPHFVFLVQDIC